MKAGQLEEHNENASQKYLKEALDYKYALEESCIVAITDQRGIIKYANDNFCKISKYSVDELIGQNHRIINSGFHTKEFFRDLWTPISRGKIWRGEIKNKAKDGTYYWVDTTIVPFLNEAGLPYQYVAIRADITKRKLAEEEVNRLHEETEAVLNRISDSVISVDNNWRYTFLNDAAMVTHPGRKQDIIGKSIWKVHPEMKGTIFWDKYHEAMQTKKVVEIESYYAPMNIWVSVKVYPSIDGLTIFYNDITAKKENEDLIQSIYAASLDAVIIVDESGCITKWDSKSCRLFGWTEQEVIGRKLSEIIIPIRYRVMHENAIKYYLKAGEAPALGKTIDICAVKKNDVEFDIAFSISPSQINGRKQFIGFVRDISENKKAEVQKEFDRNNLYALINNTEDLLWSVDREARLITFNQPFCEIIKLISGQELAKGDDVFSLALSPAQLNRFRVSYARAFAGENFTEIEHNETPVEFWSEISYYPIRKGNEVIGTACHSRNITERKLAERERTRMVSDLMLRNKELEQFAFIVSHNLRAPVANILGAVSELNEPGVTIEDQDMLRAGLNESVTKLDNVVKDLSQILQVKQETIETREWVALSTLVEDIKISIKNLIDKDHINIKYDFAEVDKLLTLKSYLYSIFYNLICNSIKFRKRDVPCIIEIRSHRVDDKVKLVFIDNGMGIDLQRNADHIFGLYKRFHPTIEGKGMGLFMVKTQVEALGGKMTLRSEVNKGTEFAIEF